jgi:hypothetical protein
MSSTRSKANGNGTPSSSAAAAITKGKDKAIPVSSKDVLHQTLPLPPQASSLAIPSVSGSFKASSNRPQPVMATGKAMVASALKGANPLFARFDGSDNEDADETEPILGASFKKEATIKTTMPPPASKPKSPVSSARSAKRVEKGKTLTAPSDAAEPQKMTRQHPVQDIEPMMITESEVQDMIPDDESEQFPMANEAMEVGLHHHVDNHDIEIQDQDELLLPTKDTDNVEQNNIEMISDDKGAAAEIEENDAVAAFMADEATEQQADAQEMQAQADINVNQTVTITASGEGGIPPPIVAGSAAIQTQHPQPASIEKELEELQAFAVNAVKEAFNQSQASRLYDCQRGESKALVASAYVALVIDLDSKVDNLEYLQMQALCLADAYLIDEDIHTSSAAMTS